jgi:hypothetical protein
MPVPVRVSVSEPPIVALADSVATRAMGGAGGVKSTRTVQVPLGASVVALAAGLLMQSVPVGGMTTAKPLPVVSAIVSALDSC